MTRSCQAVCLLVLALGLYGLALLARVLDVRTAVALLLFAGAGFELAFWWRLLSRRR